ATDVGGSREVAQDPGLILLVPPGAPAALSRVMEKALRQAPGAPVQAEEEKRLALRRFDARVMNRRVLGLYQDLAARKSQGFFRRFARLPKRSLRWIASRLPLLAQPGRGPCLPPNTVRILMYHCVRDGFPQDRLSVGAAAFARQLFLLREEGIPILPLSEALARLRARTLDRGAVALTFDDGYADLVREALDVMDEFHATATAYVPAALLDAGYMSERDPEAPEGDRLLTWEEVGALRESGWEIGSHTNTHADLSTLLGDALRQEIAGSRLRLEERLGAAVTTFAYPWGHLSREAVEAVREAGYASAVTVWPGPNLPETPTHLLCRTEVSGEDTLADFACKLRGGFDRFQRWRKRRSPASPEGLL
ncbi:MAG: polysaccharide deacetylase family protein, partial [Planctomycetota bacterium]